VERGGYAKTLSAARAAARKNRLPFVHQRLATAAGRFMAGRNWKLKNRAGPGRAGDPARIGLWRRAGRDVRPAVGQVPPVSVLPILATVPNPFLVHNEDLAAFIEKSARGKIPARAGRCCPLPMPSPGPFKQLLWKSPAGWAKK